MHSITRTWLALIATAASSFASAALAAPQPGQWAGQTENQGGVGIPMKLTIQDAQNASLQVGAPANCDVPMSFISEQGGTAAYNMRENRAGGVFCDRMIGGRALMRPSGDGRLILEMTTPRNQGFRAVLTPAR